MTREALIMDKEYWVTDIQSKLYEALENYRTENSLNRTQLAEALGFSKGYISRILNGDFDHRISKLVELALKIGLAPQMSFAPDGKPVRAARVGAQSAIAGPGKVQEMVNVKPEQAREFLRKHPIPTRPKPKQD